MSKINDKIRECFVESRQAHMAALAAENRAWARYRDARIDTAHALTAATAEARWDELMLACRRTAEARRYYDEMRDECLKLMEAGR